MQQLDEEQHHIQKDCEYKIINGQSWNLTRQPSILKLKDSSLYKRHHSANSSFSSDEGSRPGSRVDNQILKWNEDDILAWLKEIGFECYETMFKGHAIRCGKSLVALQEEHLKEMGVVKIGHRLELVRSINKLRKKVGLVSMEKYADMCHLMTQLQDLQFERTISLYPRRIILLRHGQSEGNVDNSLYAQKPDRELKLTPQGIQQAYTAGNKLKKLLCEESVSFYVSTFVRSKQTFEQIRQAFSDEQVLHVREDPRIREQEWGNFQDPLEMREIMAERRRIGSFYYRFPTGESGADVYDRVSTFLETMYRDMEKGGCGQNAIIVSHGLFCRLFLMRYYHWKVEKFHKLWNFENCQYAVMELQPEGNYRLVSELKSDP